MNLSEMIIKDRKFNYPLAAILWITFFILIMLIFKEAGWNNRIMMLVALVGSGALAFSDKHTINIQGEVELLLFGVETGVWLGSGSYFLFYIYTLAEEEEIKTENKDVIVPVFTCQDIRGKSVNCEANGDWRITEYDNYLIQDSDKMVSNLTALVKRTCIRVCAMLEYKSGILGVDLGQKILQDVHFQRECDKYGITFSNLIADGIASDLKQENINAYYEELFQKEKNKYPVGHNLSHSELDSIEDRIQVKMNMAKKIISNAPVVGRYDIQ